MQLSDEEREEAKKIVLRTADDFEKIEGIHEQAWTEPIFTMAEKIRNGEPVDEEYLRRLIVLKEAFDIMWDGTHKNN